MIDENIMQIVIDPRNVNRVEVDSNQLESPEYFTIDGVMSFLSKYTSKDAVLNDVFIYMAGRQALMVEINMTTGEATYEKVSLTKSQIVNKQETNPLSFKNVQAGLDSYYNFIRPMNQKIQVG